MTVRTGPAVRGVVAGANVAPECTRDSGLAGSHDEDGEPDASHEVRTDIMMVEDVQDAELGLLRVLCHCDGDMFPSENRGNSRADFRLGKSHDEIQ